MMDAKLKADWVKALRSGKYKQARACLRSSDYNGLCCLGVLAEIQGADWDLDRPLIAGVSISCDEGGWLREDYAGGLPLKLQKRLAGKNDSGEPFPEIADYIEANL